MKTIALEVTMNQPAEKTAQGLAAFHRRSAHRDPLRHLPPDALLLHFRNNAARHP